MREISSRIKNRLSSSNINYSPEESSVLSVFWVDFEGPSFESWFVFSGHKLTTRKFSSSKIRHGLFGSSGISKSLVFGGGASLVVSFGICVSFSIVSFLAEISDWMSPTSFTVISLSADFMAASGFLWLRAILKSRNERWSQTLKVCVWIYAPKFSLRYLIFGEDRKS